jgi:hypothetical protein
VEAHTDAAWVVLYVRRWLAAEHRQLMPQHEDLRLFGSIRPRQQREPAEKTNEDEIGES